MSTQPNKFQPGQKVKVTGNLLNGNIYHQFTVGDTVEVIGRDPDFTEEAFECMENDGFEQTILVTDLQPLNHD